MRLRQAQAATLRTPRRRYGLATRLLTKGMDPIYSRSGSFAKYQVLELIARVPYQSWERIAYLAIGRVYRDLGLARRVHNRLEESRGQQDNEEWHLLIMSELAAREGTGHGWLRYRLLPQVVATVYYLLSWLLFLIVPAASYRLNVDFEDHAEHGYMAFVAAHSELEQAVGCPDRRLRPLRQHRRPGPPDRLRRAAAQGRKPGPANSASPLQLTPRGRAVRAARAGRPQPGY